MGALWRVTVLVPLSLRGLSNSRATHTRRRGPGGHPPEQTHDKGMETGPDATLEPCGPRHSPS